MARQPPNEPRIKDSARRKIREKLEKLGVMLVREAKKEAPVESGRLRADITHRVTSRRGVPVLEVGNSVEYAEWVHEGTLPYTITPNDAEALHWTTEDGEDVFAQEVQHPGLPGDPYLVRAFDRVRNRMK